MQAIHTNISSLIAQYGLTTARGQFTNALQQLSTGLRINKAADDAAGYAIAQRMTAEINGFNQAGTNVNDGISLLQVAQGAIAQITDNFQQVRTLAVQAANSTYTASDRQAMQAQVDQLVAANLQIAQQTDFNGNKLLDGSFTDQQLQIGANADQTLNLSIPVAFAEASGTATVEEPLQQATVSGQVSAPLNASALKIDGYAIGASIASAQPGQTSDSAWAIANAINAANIPNLSATADTTITSTIHTSAAIAGGAI